MSNVSKSDVSDSPRLPHIILTETGEPVTAFYKGVGIGMAVVMIIAIGFFIKYKPKWTKQYERI